MALAKKVIEDFNRVYAPAAANSKNDSDKNRDGGCNVMDK